MSNINLEYLPKELPVRGKRGLRKRTEEED